ncbi:hypothetical protein HMPREF0043_01658 [Actinobaculum sp. oral taxon 183 str. F0552]|nr:hypothetical protein HMPREF0043_01658 [Actinobaculum sp. oral taxon 183 str. F0552]
MADAPILADAPARTAESPRRDGGAAAAFSPCTGALWPSPALTGSERSAARQTRAGAGQRSKVQARRTSAAARNPRDRRAAGSQIDRWTTTPTVKDDPNDFTRSPASSARSGPSG